MKINAKTLSEMASSLYAPSASSATGAPKSAVDKSVELWKETHRQVIEKAPHLTIHLPPDGYELLPVVDRIAMNAATIYPTSNVPQESKVKTVVGWAVDIYKLSRKATEQSASAGA
jgi:hypothetical protein